MRKFGGDSLGKKGRFALIGQLEPGVCCLGGCGCSCFRDQRQDVLPNQKRGERPWKENRGSEQSSSSPQSRELHRPGWHRAPYGAPS